MIRRHRHDIIPMLLSALLVTGCEGGGSLDQLSSSGPEAQFVNLSVLSYDTTTAHIRVRGHINALGVTDLSMVQFFSDSVCGGALLASGLESDFNNVGVDMAVSSTTPTDIYVNTSTVATCYRLTRYDATHVAPDVPQFSSTLPASPSHESSTPSVFGTASGTTSLVRLYDDSACTNLVGSGTGSDLSTTGVGVVLPAETESTLYIKAYEAFGASSACTSFATYKHSSLGPAAPFFVSTTPASPTKLTTTPAVKGTLDASAVSVTLYSDSACGAEIGSGTATDFTGAGVQVTVADNATTGIYVKALDADGDPSPCAHLIDYVNDTTAPSAPTYASATPASPTRLTIYPRIKGTASADTTTVRLFNAPGCLNMIGSGSKTEFESTGTLAGVTSNWITAIYAEDVDAAGNTSACTFFANYKNNTIPPDPPVFNTTDPISPNNLSTTPLILGAPPATAVSVQIYSEDTCTNLIGSGTAAVFDNPGIQVTVPANQTTEIFATATDTEGNISDCTSLTSYSHSTLPAPAPVFTSSSPASPSRISFKPSILGTTGATVSKVDMFTNAACTAKVGSASRLTFTTSGVVVTLPQNTTSSIYGQTTDVYGNQSACTYMTDYTHTNIAPLAPAFVSTTPTSPTNTSTSPLVIGTSPANPSAIIPVSEIDLYDSIVCLNKIGTGTPNAWATTGLTANVGPNTVNLIYAKAFDAAGNASGCTFMTSYTHSNKPPGKPSLVAVSPTTPSYEQAVVMRGTLGSTQDILPPTDVKIYSDSLCSTLLAASTPAAWTGAGIPVTMPANQITSVYGATYDIVGNRSVCNLLVNFQHSDIGPAGMSAGINIDGSVALTWMPDLVASPAPTYNIKRSLKSGGPYTVIATGVNGNAFTDMNVTNGATYYYVVSATNVTGTSKDSGEANVTVATGAPAAAVGLTATPGAAEVALAWTGFNSNMSFKILRSTQRGGPYSLLIGSLSSSTYFDRSVANGVNYYYVVVGTNPAGDSLMSAEATATPVDYPGAPTGLTMQATLSSPACGGAPGVQLSWSAPEYFTSFNIGRGGSSGSYQVFANTNSESWVDCNPRTVSNSLNYGYYAISATWGSQGASAWSNEVVFLDEPAPTLTVSPGNSSAFLAWSALPSATGYRLSRATKSGGPYTVIAANNAGSTYFDGGLTNGTTYYYIVEALYPNNGIGWLSTDFSGTPNANPTSPSNLIVSPSAGKPQLDWTPPSNYNAFNVYRASSGAGPWTYIGSVPTSTFTDISPPTGLAYYRVTAVWGAFESGPTNVATFRVGIPALPVATPNASTIALSWSSVTGANGYAVYRGTAAGGPYTLLGTTVSNSYNDATALAAIGYFYVIRSTFADGSKSEPSVEVSGMRLGTNVPGGLTAVSTTSSSVSLAWSKVTNAAIYSVYKSTAPAGPFTLVNSGVATSMIVTSLVSSSTYYFTVTATVGGVQSAQSAAVSAKTYSPPLPPSGSPGNGVIDLTWNSVAGATSYTVQRSTDGVNFSTIASGIPVVTYSDSPVTNGVIYFYRLIASYPGVSTTSMMSSGITPGVVPLAPSGVAVTGNVTGTDLTLAWGTVSGATAYNVYLSTTSGGPWGAPAMTIASTTNNTLTGLTAGQTYYITVTALRGSVESARSGEISAMPSVTPTAPVAAASGTSVGLTWSTVTGAVSYNVERSSDLVFYQVISTGIGTTSYTDATVTDGQGYVYRYVPYAAGGVRMAESAWSSPVTPGTMPLAPTGLFGSAPNTATVNLSWVAAPTVSSYNVYRGTSAGGPYTLLATVPSTSTSYSDGAVAAGNTYFYVVSSLNASAVESPMSNEVAIYLGGIPTGVNASASNGSIGISWNAVGGAVSYLVRRSDVAGGPYGTVGSPAGATFTDSNIVHGKSFYYVVEAVFASGAKSPKSAEVSAVGSSTIDLQVPVELTDRALSSSTVPVTFERTRTAIDTNAYDGVVTYSYEVVASNFDGSAQNVDLVDSSGSVVGTIAVAAGTSTPRRYRASFTPVAGSEEYRLKLAATVSSDDLVVHSARILIKQVGASMTKVYIPLLSSDQPPSNADLGGAAAQISAVAYGDLTAASIYLRDTTRLATIDDFNGWEFETVFSANGGATGSVTLYNVSSGTPIVGTETIFSGAAVTHDLAPFDEGVSGFDAASEGNQIQASIRCRTGCSTGSVSLYKAGLWVRLTHLEKASLYYRDSLGASAISSLTTLDGSRQLFSAADFTNPTVSFEATAIVNGGVTGAVSLVENGTNDFGTGGVTPVPGSTLSLNQSFKTLVKTGAPLTLTTGQRYMPQVDPSTGSVDLLNSAFVVDVTK